LDYNPPAARILIVGRLLKSWVVII